MGVESAPMISGGEKLRSIKLVFIAKIGTVLKKFPVTWVSTWKDTARRVGDKEIDFSSIGAEYSISFAHIRG